MRVKLKYIVGRSIPIEVLDPSRLGRETRFRIGYNSTEADGAVPNRFISNALR